MGLFDKIRRMVFSGSKYYEQDTYTIPDFDAGLWRRMSNDAEYQMLSDKYYKMSEKIEATYSVINSMNAFDKSAGDTFIELCRETIDIIERIYPKWKMYNQVPYANNVYKRMAMAYEKRGQYKEAADVCLEAIRIGFESDGTNGGYLGRMVRMLKKGKIEPNSEMKYLISKMFEN